MATIVTRASKGSALSHTEMDSNFINLNTDKTEKTSVQSLHSTDALRISGNTISLYKGDGTHEDVVLPAVDSDTLYDTAHSFSTNGYQKLSNGLIIQWLTTPIIGYNSNTWVNLPIAFPTATLSAVSTSKSAIDVFMNITDVSEAQIRVNNRDAGSGQSSTAFIMAIGY